MSYTNSKASVGLGSALNISTTAYTASPAYVSVGEILELTQSGTTNKFATVTNLQSLGEEFLAVLPAGGSFDFTVNRVGSDAGQIALKAAFVSKLLTAFQTQLEKTPAQTSVGDSYTFTAYVEEFDDTSSITPEKQLITKCKLKISGALPALTAGS